MGFIVNLEDFKIEFKVSDEDAQDAGTMEGLPKRIGGYDVFDDVESITRYTQKEIATMSRLYLHTKGTRCRTPEQTAEKLLAVWEADESIEVFPVKHEGDCKDHPKHGNRKRDCYHDLKDHLIAIHRNPRLWTNRNAIAKRFGAKHNLAENTVKLLYTEVRQDNPQLLEIPNRPNVVYKKVVDDNQRKNKTREFCIADLVKAFDMSEETAIKIIDGKQ